MIYLIVYLLVAIPCLLPVNKELIDPKLRIIGGLLWPLMIILVVGVIIQFLLEDLYLHFKSKN